MPLVDAFNSAIAQAPSGLHLKIVDNRLLFDELKTYRKSYTPLCDYQSYNELLATSDVCCMPLVNSVFSRSKSDLKFVEAASHGVTVVASDIVYGDVVDDGATGLIYRHANEFKQHLVDLFKDPERGRRIGLAARDYVSRYRMQAYQVSQRIAWYRSLSNRQSELTRQLSMRLRAIDADEPSHTASVDTTLSGKASVQSAP